MKQSYFTMVVQDGIMSWTEDITCILDKKESCKERAEKIIQDFNFYHTHHRKVLLVREKAFIPDLNLPHKWEKTNLVSQSIRGRIFDTYKCEQCGITAKRFAFGSIIPDPKFEQYAHNCPNKKIK